MQLFRTVVLFLFITSFWAGCQASGPGGPAAAVLPAAPADSLPGFALLELFTSQGCSSCPPADALLAELVAEQQGRPVYALSFHVDYWNRLGWQDPYSDALYSARQRTYARHLPEGRVYTPQLVINGRRGLVGSRAREVRAALDEALANPARTGIVLEAGEGAGATRRYTYQLSGRTADLHLYIALAEKEAVNEVLRGENRGRELRHVQVVRQFFRIEAPGQGGEFAVDWSTLDDPARGQLIVRAQDAASWAVMGAAAVGK
jgi:hypothetical protein